MVFVYWFGVLFEYVIVAYECFLVAAIGEPKVGPRSWASVLSFFITISFLFLAINFMKHLKLILVS